MRLRCNDGRLAGHGMSLAFVEHEDTYEDFKERNVVFPNHSQKEASPVTTYKIAQNGELVKI